eukprot:Platyproteum_vivax@DN799_c0_g1_i2.p1
MANLESEESKGNVVFRLFFVNANNEATIDKEFNLKTLVKDVKKQITDQHSDIIKVENLERVRLICSGKELEDSKTIEENQLTLNSMQPTCMHVVGVEKKGAKSTCCSSWFFLRVCRWS